MRRGPGRWPSLPCTGPAPVADGAGVPVQEDSPGISGNPNPTQTGHTTGEPNTPKRALDEDPTTRSTDPVTAEPRHADEPPETSGSGGGDAKAADDSPATSKAKDATAAKSTAPVSSPATPLGTTAEIASWLAKVLVPVLLLAAPLLAGGAGLLQLIRSGGSGGRTA